MGYIIAAAAVLVLASFLYGVFRKFTQMSWVAWQIPIIFALTLLFKLVPEEWNGIVRALIGVGIVAAATVLVLVLGAAIRKSMLKKMLPAHPVWRFVNRLLGGITALLDYVVIALVLGGAALAVCYYVITPPSFLSAVYDLAIWKNFLAGNIFDLFVVTVLVLALRGGWRVGLGRTVFIFLMLALTFAAFVFSFWLAVSVPFFSNMAGGLSKSFANYMNGVTAGVLGTSVIAGIVFVILFILICLLGIPLNKLVRNVRYHYFWGTLDGVLGCILGIALALAALVGLYILVQALANGTLNTAIQELLESIQIEGEGAENIKETIVSVVGKMQEWGEKIAVLLRSSPLSRALYGAFIVTP